MHKLTIASIESINNSVNGNPRYKIRFDEGEYGTCITSSDIADAYDIGNPGYDVGDPVAVTFTKAGRIATIKSTLGEALTDKLSAAKSLLGEVLERYPAEAHGSAWLDEAIERIGSCENEVEPVEEGRRVWADMSNEQQLRHEREQRKKGY